ncbi:hypothetical protein KVV02_004152 [Mortierella alpina]|uniref:G-protein coupled receptors family 3 profile domain-containing protein n=1 Tax=Mortierella alpina TaxID=64518 RepID=A0A9P8AAL1_MORAP|nr:hypothetical protein KVV02_004152 [Mortierella alpina]
MRPLHAPSTPSGFKAASILLSITMVWTALCTEKSNRPHCQLRPASRIGLVRLMMISTALLVFVFSGSAATADTSRISATKSAEAPALSSNCLTIQHADYDPPVHLPGMTDKEFNETYHGIPNTLKIGVLLPFTSDSRYTYRDHVARVSFSVLRMAVKNMNDRQTIPGMNISLVLRDSQQLIPGMNISGGASAISATTRLLALEVGSVIGDVTSDLTQAEALMTSSIGVPQCSFASYNMDTSDLLNFKYLFRTVPAVVTYIQALAEVIVHYKWQRVSILYTSDVPGLLGNMGFPYTGFCTISASAGLFQKDHVWMTAIDLSDSLSVLTNPLDFNGLIMADALWDLSGDPTYDKFVSEWMNLDPKEYPSSGYSQLTWHESFAYTCLQVIAEGYKGLVENAMNITNTTTRNDILSDIKRGRRSQDLTIEYLGSKEYDTPVGNFSLSKEGDPTHVRVSISTFQNGKSVANGRYTDGSLAMFKPIKFKDGTTNVPLDAPAWDELFPDNDNPFELVMIVLSTGLMLAIIFTAVIVLLNRENIIIKSASPLFCVLELVGLAITLSWVFYRTDVPSAGTCRMGMMVVVVGLTINLSALVVKNYRIYRIFNSVTVINHAVSNNYLLRVVAVPVIITLIPCIVQILVRNLEPKLVRTENQEFWVMCSSSGGEGLWIAVIGATPILLNVFGIYLAFKTRNVIRLWNEARSIAITIYMVSLFIIVVIIVHTFPKTLYHVTYHVTMVAIFLVTFLEFAILFYPKLKNLWLQKKGLHVAAGREDDMMDGILGGMTASPARRGGISAGDRGAFTSGIQEEFMGHDEKRYGVAAARIIAGSDQVSMSSTDMQRNNPNISDLISSYPFGQINDNTNAEVSPVHCPTIYGSSSLVNRAGKRGDRAFVIENLDLPEPSQSLLRTKQAATVSPAPHPVTTLKLEALHPKAAGYDTFGGDRATALRNSAESQPLGMHEMLMVSSATRPAEYASGMLTVAKPDSYQRPSSYNGQESPSIQDYIGSSVSEQDPYSRKSSVGDISNIGLGKLRSGNPQSRSPRLYPLQPYGAPSGGIMPGSLRSIKQSLRETKMDSYTVTVPVQRQRWYIMQFLAQWRMSKIIFVPYSKVLVIVDLETEKSESLILHSIERGYSPEELEARLAARRSSLSTLPVVVADSIDAVAAPVRPPVRPSLTTESTATKVTAISLPNTYLASPAGSPPLSAADQRHLRRRLDARNMDGVNESTEEAGIDGLAEVYMSDYVIRVISIHNECWRVQLPDQDTMDRWIEIGQQIKDENWITRPLNTIPIATTAAPTRRNNSISTVTNNVEGRNGSDGFALRRDSLSVDTGRPTRPVRENSNRGLHPLQSMSGSYLAQPSAEAGPQLPLELDKSKSQGGGPTESIEGSNDPERVRIRKQAALLNQQLKESRRYAPLRGLISGGGGLGEKRSRSPASTGPGGRPSSPLVRSLLHRRPSSVTGLKTMSEPKTSPPSGLRDVVGERPKSSTSMNRLSEVDRGSEDEEARGDAGVAAGGGSTREFAHIKDVLAETNVAYDQGQYAVYDDLEPGHEHKSHRFFNNLQYNYNRRRLGHEDSALFPQSPEWHLTTFELEAMEAERSSQSGGSGTRGQDMASTENPASDSAMGDRPNPSDQVQHLSDPGVPSVVDNKDLMVAGTARPLSVPPGSTPGPTSESPTAGVARPVSSSPRSANKHTAGEDRERPEAQLRKQPLFPPQFARFQSLSPSMMHLPPLTLKNISDESLEREPSAEPLDITGDEEAVDHQL